MKKQMTISILALCLVCGMNLSARAAGDHAAEVMKEEGGSDFSLMEIMHDLAFQLSRIQFGIFTNNRYMIKEGAAGIGHHPKPHGGIKPYLRKNAEQIKKAIPEMDRNIHETAIKINDVADTESMENLQKMTNHINENCVACHNMFRD